MSDFHIEEFYHDIGLILSRLYASFPRRSQVYVEEISGADNVDEYGMHSERHLSCFSAIIWLKDHGYIDYECTVRQESADQAVLSQKSFLLLSSQSTITFDDDRSYENLPPYAQKKAITHINILRKALKSQSAINISKVVFHLMEQAKHY